MPENRRRGSAPDKEALAALGTAAPSRLRKAAPSDVVSELASQPAPAAVQPAATPAAALAKDKPAAKAAPKKTSFYQLEEDADRMRAAYMNTQMHTRYRSLSEFINMAIDEKVSALEKTYNGGQEWPPLAAREIPQGKPLGN
ncbi:ParB family protein [Arthrobacter sp. KNU-44]|uniref:ParB family protein n=1 Tax=Arthrobacter sp. KNU-44 TaxID=3450744 RepID=UPI003F4361A8